jgi:hypothetical protein
MSFLAPLFLLGAAAVVLPIAFHLVRRTTRQRTLFSSLLFLPPSPPRVTQRSRLEDLLLLALRCLVLALLALGFARPFLRNSVAIDPSVQPPKRIILLVDTSASMRRAGLWEAAQARANARARAASPQDEIAVWTFDRAVRPLVGFTEWNATPLGNRDGLVASRLSAIEPGWGETRLDLALTAAAEGIVENTDRLPPAVRQVVLISDLQEGSRLDRLQAFEWPKGVEVAIEPLKSRRPGNAGLQVLSESASIAATTQSVVRVRVFNSPDGTQDRFEIGWAGEGEEGFIGQAQEVQVSPGHTRTAVLPLPPTGTAADRIMLRGDDEAFDNRVFLVPPHTDPMRALYVGTETEEEQRQPLFYLRRAFPPSGRLAVEVVSRRPAQGIDPAAIQEAALYIITANVPQDVGEALGQQVRSGKTLIFAPSSTDGFAALGPIVGGPPVPATEVQPRTYAMLGNIDFSHPLLVPFADPRFSDFTKIHFWKYRRFDASLLPEPRTVWTFDSGDPALVELSLGRGKLVVLASGWHPDDSQLALSTKFVPLLLSIVEHGGDRASESSDVLVVGDSLPLPAGAGPRSIRVPGGTSVPLSQGATNFTETLVPGIYSLESAQGPARFAVNLDGLESRTSPLELEAIEGAGAPLGTPTARAQLRPERKIQLAAIEAEGRQKLWRWLILAALAVLLLESAVAAWQGRRLLVGKETGS